MDELKVDNFYKNWLKIMPQLNEGYIFDDRKNLRPTRDVFIFFKKLINNFLENKISEFEKIILLPGLRGVGKTTLLMQILKIEKFLNPDDPLDSRLIENLTRLDYRFYFDVSKLHFEQISLQEFFKYFEKTNNFNFVNLDKKTILLLDEVHFDDGWSLFLKVLFDSLKGHKNLLVIASGSSAINLKMSADLMRRATVMEIFPMKFDEYLLFKHRVSRKGDFSEKLRNIIFSSEKAKDVFAYLKSHEMEAFRFYSALPYEAEDEFFKNGGFPFVAALQNEVELVERIKSVINGIIAKDIITLKRFRTETISKIVDLLYLLANSDVISYEKMLQALRIENVRTISSLLDVLVMSGILVKIKSYGRSYGATRKTAKYLFITPSLRSALLDNIFTPRTEGKKLEDYFALIFEKHLKKEVAYSLSYDSAEGGADFVLTLKDRTNIVIEIGFNKEGTNQVEKTMKKVQSRYGLVFGSSQLELVKDSIVKVPLKFLLMV